MKVAQFDAVVASLPFLATEGGCKPIANMPGLMERHGATGNDRYGKTPGQLGQMPEGSFDMVVSSPPYVDSMNSAENGIDWTKVTKDYPGRVMHEDRIASAERHHSERRYGSTDGQLGQMPEGDFDEAVGG